MQLSSVTTGMVATWPQFSECECRCLKNKFFKVVEQQFLPPANEVREGYVFTLVCLSTGGGWYPSMPCRWYPSMPCKSPGGCISSMPCRFPGPHPGKSLRGLAGGGGLQAHTQGRSPGPHPGGSPGGGVYPSMHLMATAAGSTHPTGMHSCSFSYLKGFNFWPGKASVIIFQFKYSMLNNSHAITHCTTVGLAFSP